MRPTTTALPGFRHLSVPERRRALAEAAGLAPADLDAAFDRGGVDVATADQMVENAIGVYALPIGVGLYLRINGQDFLAPMAVEEPSVIAAASHACKRVRAAGGFTASADPSLMTAQIALHEVADPAGAVARLCEARAELIELAHAALPSLRERGGGARDILARDLGDGLVVVHLVVDCLDAMGANMLNTVAEALGPRVAAIGRGELGLRILSNYCDQRLVRVSARIPVADFGGGEVDGPAAALGVVRASDFASKDVYRAVTHNKGIMNGVDAVVIATGGDFRAVEAGAHAHAARSGRYEPLATWRLEDEGASLVGRLEMPLALGTVGGALRAHSAACTALALSGAASAAELGMIAASVGLASNLSALRALATEGIQRGHMSLHRRAKEPVGERTGHG